MIKVIESSERSLKPSTVERLQYFKKVLQSGYDIKTGGNGGRFMLDVCGYNDCDGWNKVK